MAETGRTRVGDFEILEKIGEGSLGTVFKAVCLSDGPIPLVKGMSVALKRLHPSADLPRETRALESLAHPNIVRFLSCFVSRQGEWDEASFLVTELLEGHDLGIHLQAHPGGLPWEEARRILDQVLDALAFAETRGVVHRDLKPSNLFLCRDGSVKVIDFGLARKTGGTVSLATGGDPRTGLTGTLDYMAPEFARVEGFRGDGLSDMFSFGVLACQIMTGMLPFSSLGEHPEIAFIRRWTGPQAPRALVPRPVAYAFEGAAAFLARALNPVREGRFPSFGAAREALAAIRPRILAGAQENYILEAFLASGGFCDVFRARSRSGSLVAIKRLHAGRHEWRFRREAGLLHTLQALNHPALVRLHELIEEPGPDGAPGLVMEYLPGPDLRRRLSGLWEKGLGLHWTETVRLFIRYLEGLEALHAQGITHRDIKPANLYAPDGHPEEGKLLDLGVACEQNGTVSIQGLPPGTLDYMAPELASESGGRGTPQSDLFALGCSLYEALSGHPALKRLPPEDAAAIRALCARSGSEAAFSEAFEGFTAPVFSEQPELAVIVAQALRFDPASRYGGAEEGGDRWTGAGARRMREALQAVLDAVSPVIGTTPVPVTSDRTVTHAAEIYPRKRMHRPTFLLTAGLAAGLVAVAGAWLFISDKGAEAPPPEPIAVSAPVMPTEAPAVESPRDPAEEVTADIPAPVPSVAVPSVPEALPVVAAPALPAVTGEPPRVVIRPAAPVSKPVEPPLAASAPAAPSNAPALASTLPPAAPELVKAEVTDADLQAAEDSIGAWRVWLTRLDNPLLSVTLRRYQPGAPKPAWRGTLPFLLAPEREALPPALRGRLERSLIWEQAAADLTAGRDPAPRSEALRALAGSLAAHEPALAGQCRFEARLLDWKGKGLAADDDPAPAEAAIWRIHARAAAGDEQDARELLKGVADFAGLPGAGLLSEDALLAVRAAELVLAGAVEEIRDRSSVEVVAPGTGRAVRDPVAAYAQAVNRLRQPVAEGVNQLLTVARATGAEAAGQLKTRLERDRLGPALGDRVWSLAELDATPWREGRAVWAERAGGVPEEERAILAHLRGEAPLPGRVEDIPVARLRGKP